ncbi:hypothetical protein HY486_00470 [Candidatus Woesearchaeota archaeon]|nr:hypothetical protein [Candidatus Woesearchaeota archaeon]
MARKTGCTCNVPRMLLGVLAIALGIYLVVLGWANQSMRNSWGAIFFYFIGVLAIVLGKRIKCEAMECSIH